MKEVLTRRELANDIEYLEDQIMILKANRLTTPQELLEKEWLFQEYYTKQGQFYATN